jgi:DNA-binding MarR family transcriptional regulator
MRTTSPKPTSAPASGTSQSSAEPLLESILDELHGMIGSLRCAGTGRMVKAGISMTHLHILWVLDHHGALPMSRLADLLDVSFSNATGLIDRMAERGLVERVRVPDDRRVVIVRASADGVRMRDEIEALKHERMRAILGRLDTKQLTRLRASIGDLRVAVAEEIGAEHLGQHIHPN